MIALSKSQKSASGFERSGNFKKTWRVSEWILPLIAFLLTMSLAGCGEDTGQLRSSKKLVIKHLFEQYKEDISKLNRLVADGDDYFELNEKYSDLIESQLLTDATPKELGDIAIYVRVDLIVVDHAPLYLVDLAPDMSTIYSHSDTRKRNFESAL